MLDPYKKNPITEASSRGRSQAHAARRARERYGLDLTRGDLEEIGVAVASDPRVRIVHRSAHHANRVTAIVPLRGRDTIVVYDREIQSIVTFLPEGKTPPSGDDVLARTFRDLEEMANRAEARALAKKKASLT